MTEREKVIKGLQEAVDWLSTETSLTVVDQWIVRDALTLLKAQEPRVMTHYEMENAIPGTVVYCEQRDEVRTYLTPMIKYDDGVFENRFLGAEPEAVFLPNIRFWTSRPTDEQREATPWN